MRDPYKPNPHHQIISNYRDMAELMQSYKWEDTPLGPLDKWPQSIQNFINIMHNLNQPVAVLCGEELNLIYNASFAEWLNKKHPNTLGMPFFTVFPKLKDDLSPVIEKVSKGEKVQLQDVILDKNTSEPGQLDIMFSPLWNNNNSIDGILCLLRRKFNIDEDAGLPKRSGEKLKQEVTILRKLHQMNTSILQVQNLDKALNLILRTVIRLLHADFGHIQLLNSDKGELEIVAHQGFEKDFTDFFNLVAEQNSTDRQSIENAERVVIEDVNLDEAYQPYKEMALKAGFQAVQSSPLINRSGKILGILSTHYKKPYELSEKDIMILDLVTIQITDIITHFLEDEEIFRKKEQEIEKIKNQSRQKDEILNIASHELKTPLTSLSAYVQLLQENVQILDEETTQKYLKKTEGSVHRLSHLLSDLLAVSRIQSGKIEFNFRSFDLREMIQDSIEVARLQSKRHHVKLSDNHETIVYGDRDKLQQVMDNYLSNAIKYSPDGGEIIICITHKNSDVIISVADCGIGIPPEMLSEIFLPYCRAEVGYKISGLGLGLYICSEIIEGHKGKYWAESVKGQGSIFYFSIPQHKDKSSVG